MSLTTIEINRSLAGSRRNRKNAVDLEKDLDAYIDRSPTSGKGRPSKGGEKIRAKRYYVKNHLLVLHKRKLKRYHDKVMKLLSQYMYNEDQLLNELKKKCATYRAKYSDTNEYHLMYYANIVREDKYLPFLEEAANAFLESYNEENPPMEIMQPLERTITTKHSLLLLHICTLLSAYLLVHHVKEDFKEMPDGKDKEERIQKACIEQYVMSYEHLISLYKDVSEDENETANRVFNAVADGEDGDQSSANEQENGEHEPTINVRPMSSVSPEPHSDDKADAEYALNKDDAASSRFKEIHQGFITKQPEEATTTTPSLINEEAIDGPDSNSTKTASAATPATTSKKGHKRKAKETTGTQSKKRA